MDIKSGDRFTRLVALRYTRTIRTNRYWLFACDCGREKEIRLAHVTSGKTRSCRCLGIETARLLATNHGLSATRAFGSWGNAKKRCESPGDKAYANYGARGIRMCLRWSNDFAAFFADMGERPVGLTLERIDNDKGYEPGNCRWATRSDQNLNRRSAVIVRFRGEDVALQALARRFGVDLEQLRKLIQVRKLSPEQAIDHALAAPVQRRPSRPRRATS